MKLRNALVFFLTLFLAFPAFAMSVGMMAGAGSAAAVATDSCTSGLLFSWHMENLNVTLGGVAGGVNNGCSAGDTTATAASAAVISNALYQDGANSASYPTASDYFEFVISNDDIADDAAGTAIFYLRITTFIANSGLVSIRYDGTNYIKITLQGTDDATGREARINYVGAGTGRTATTTAANMALDTWYKITAKWSVAGSGANYLFISVDDANGINGTTALTGLATTPIALRVGETEGSAANLNIDNLKVYNSWL